MYPTSHDFHQTLYRITNVRTARSVLLQDGFSGVVFGYGLHLTVFKRRKIMLLAEMP